MSTANDRFPCPCCGHLVFDEPPGSHDICGICFWEDDYVQLRWPDRGGANGPLVDAQENFARFGAVEERLVPHVRSPRDDEPLDPGWRPIDRDVDAYTEWGGESLSPGPADPTALYYWRPGFWRTDPSTTLATYDPPSAVDPSEAVPFDEIRRIAEAYVSVIQRGSGTPVLAESGPIEKPYGWVFVLRSVEGPETGEVRPGNVTQGPFVVRKSDGLIDVLGATHPLQHYLDLYEQGRWGARGIRVGAATPAARRDEEKPGSSSPRRGVDDVGVSSSANQNVFYAALSKLLDWLKG